MLLFAAVAISASITACSDDDDDNEPGGGKDSVTGKAKELVGLWCHAGSNYTDWTRFNADGSGFMDAEDRNGTYGDYFTNYRVRFSDHIDAYKLDIMWIDNDDEEWDTDIQIDFIDKETISLNWGSGWYTYHKQ